MIDLKTAFDAAYEERDWFNEPFTDLKGLEKLASLCSNKPKCMITNVTNRGEVIFSANPYDIANNASLEDIKYLVKCGIHYNRSDDIFYMYV